MANIVEVAIFRSIFDCAKQHRHRQINNNKEHSQTNNILI